MIFMPRKLKLNIKDDGRKRIDYKEGWSWGYQHGWSFGLDIRHLSYMKLHATSMFQSTLTCIMHCGRSKVCLMCVTVITAFPSKHPLTNNIQLLITQCSETCPAWCCWPCSSWSPVSPWSPMSTLSSRSSTVRQTQRWYIVSSNSQERLNLQVGEDKAFIWP